VCIYHICMFPLKPHSAAFSSDALAEDGFPHQPLVVDLHKQFVFCLFDILLVTHYYKSLFNHFITTQIGNLVNCMYTAPTLSLL